MKSILKYPGAKCGLAAQLIPLLPSGFTRYCEPFCGSAAVYFHLPYQPEHVLLNDIDGEIVNLFRALMEKPEELCRAVALTPWSYEEFQSAQRPKGRRSSVERARQFLVRTWQGNTQRLLSGSSGWSCFALSQPGTYRKWSDVPDRLQEAVARIQAAHIDRRDALKTISRVNSPETLLYVDPPYVLETRKGRGHYVHEIDLSYHERLLQALISFRGAVVLSGYDHPLYNDVLSSWYRTEIPTRSNPYNHRFEIVWRNASAAQYHQPKLFESDSVA